MLALNDDTVIGVLGLGYVGLPVALAFSRLYETRGYDINAERVDALQQGNDRSGEIDPAEIANTDKLQLTSELDELRGVDVFIVTVPTPIDQQNEPDLSLLKLACESVGQVMQSGCIVIFESTVYPGCTEEFCIPIIEDISGLGSNVDFHFGYSPERINPGDDSHRLTDVVKVTAGSNEEAANFVDELYRSIVVAGTHCAESIRVAEAAKVIENIQRDLNIALVNEFAQLFNELDIDTGDVLRAAETKWNFLPFRPGLVGGHCIGVDPYYLTYKARRIGFNPEVILAGRKINNQMAQHVAERVVELLSAQGRDVASSKILVMGATFKENCPDTRNSKSMDLVRYFKKYDAEVHLYDPVAHEGNAELPPDISLTTEIVPETYDAIVITVAHDLFKEMGAEQIVTYGDKDAVIFDVKHLLPREMATARL